MNEFSKKALKYLEQEPDNEYLVSVIKTINNGKVQQPFNCNHLPQPLYIPFPLVNYYGR